MREITITILLAVIIGGLILTYAYGIGREQELPPREFERLYATIHVPRWEHTLCYQCHQ